MSDPIAKWHSRLLPGDYRGLNALTVDVEDYFQVESLSEAIARNEWDAREPRIEANMERILALLEGKAHATFYTLGWIAGRFPAMIKRITATGHELGSHGMAHHRADQQTPQEFTADITRAKALLEDVSGTPVLGYRAATFSITRQNLWAYDCLKKAGYRYSSSIYPIHHDLYGIPEAPRFAFHPLEGNDFIEIPVTTVRRMGMNWPCGGGGYFRLLPYRLSAFNLASVHKRDHKPCNFYFHPWEIDPGQPRVAGISAKTRFRHYLNLDKTEARLQQLLTAFAWDRMDRVYGIS